MTSFQNGKVSHLRLLAIIPFILSATAFVLQLVAVLSGLRKGQLESYSIMSLNTSTLGQNLITFTPIGASTNKRQFDPLDPFNLFPGTTATLPASTGLVSSVTGPSVSATSALVSAPPALSIPLPTLPIPSILTSLPIPTGLPSLGGNTSSLSGFFSGSFSYLLQAFLTPIIIAADGSLEKIEAKIVSDFTDAFGIHDYYTLHLMALCKGNYSSPSEGNAKLTTESCTTYSKFASKLKSKVSINIPSSFNILATNVSVPPLAEVSPLTDEITSLGKLLAGFSSAFHIIALVGTAGTATLSAIAIFMPNSFRIVQLVTLFSFLSTTFQTITAIVFTLLVTIATQKINKFGNSLGIYAAHGSGFLALTWTAFALGIMSGIFWEATWFVQTRRTSFKRRLRTEKEMGNWKGIWKEVRSDIKRPASDKEVGMEEAIIQSVSRSKLVDKRSPMRRRSTYSLSKATRDRSASTVSIPKSRET